MIDKLKKLFGGPENYNYTDLDDLEKVEPVAADAISGDEPVELIDTVLEVINSQLPPLVKDCINRDAQRQMLQTMLGSALTDYAARTRQEALSELTGDKAKMQKELEELRAEKKDVAARREEQKANLLSEQRQRRALQDRNRDLESKIAELDSEIEQHKLTISSLMNKVRVAEVTGDVSDDVAEIITAKENEIAGLTAKVAELTALNSAQSEKLTHLEEVLQQKEAALAATNEEKPKRKYRKRQRPETADGDASELSELEGVDWLLPGGTPAGHTPTASDPEFGYQPPKPSPAPFDDSQLTLF